ncbi:uncharacterized protein METZ01_LOCUS97534, partial [marine metagenome]
MPSVTAVIHNPPVSNIVNFSISVGFCSARLRTILGNITATIGPTKKINARP